MRRKIYIDLGAFVGKAINEFYETHSDASEYLVYAWEPLLNNYKVLTNNIAAMGWDNVIPMFFAASNKDGISKFFSNSSRDSDGGTLVDGKRTGALLYDNPVEVKCKDFCKWFKLRIRADDYVYLKMNIEGGEYEILDDMINSGVLDDIDEFKFWLHIEKINDGPYKKEYEHTHNRFLNVLENNHNIKSTRLD